MLIIEGLAILLSMLPLALMWVLPNMLEEVVGAELELFVGGLSIYILYPALSLVISFICAWFSMEWYIAILSVPCAFFLAAITYFPAAMVDILLFVPGYAAVGALIAWPISRYKKRKSETDRMLGKII